MGFNRFNSKPVFIVPGAKRPIFSKKDMEYYCIDHDVDKKTVVRFDSTKEYERYLMLQALEREGKISELKRQVAFEIIPAHGHDSCIRFKDVPIYRVGNEVLDKMADARVRAKELGIKACDIVKDIKTIPIYKYIVDETNAVYTADFTYIDEDGDYIVEDTKSDITRKQADYVLRRKLMLDRLGIKIKET